MFLIQNTKISVWSRQTSLIGFIIRINLNTVSVFSHKAEGERSGSGHDFKPEHQHLYQRSPENQTIERIIYHQQRGANSAAAELSLRAVSGLRICRQRWVHFKNITSTALKTSMTSRQSSKRPDKMWQSTNLSFSGRWFHDFFFLCLIWKSLFYKTKTFSC